MREILFRGKRKDTGEWVEGTLDNIDKPYRILFRNPNVEVYTVETETVGQYTGLTDKNGMRIFEGDIVTVPNEDNPALIEWEDNDAKFIISSLDVDADFDNYWSVELEVIGNVFDNPELLK